MKTVSSKDGTVIAFDQSGTGPALILIHGATQYRATDRSMRQLADLLARHFTVVQYDRRGRGESTDTLPFAEEREIEDIEALIDAVGGSTFLYGMSSGAVLAMEAVTTLPTKIRKLAMYEPPFNDDEAARQRWKEYTGQLRERLAQGRRGDAMALFLRLVGVPAERIEGMRPAPTWPMNEAVAPTLAYDHGALMGDEAAVPVERAASVTVPTLILVGGASYGFMHQTAEKLARAIPDADWRTLEGQTHAVAAPVLAPVLEEFFLS
ncbi:alpha/beta hydrolase (plasmid) [Deinococcus aetherius]|uniref:Alpha/beta hydrolase n=1 Tax=Deinococcus aetherius TaxID=200252 RepID=A0ABN6RMI8_9DEIO|nr:alpha/beta hydrolase [Deinococcus aetherius]BDP43899.1 alpha/beta hydrolase [Deinococcus aetherius]